ncbi:hypothetical protein CHX26_06525 [Porphyrobacter sp. HT-58-2]|uniref:hypothetical protein n=1 Tax=Porphyrobacter sp. HT-58-2 TaxID=2023229 RepID=UPI000CDC9F59|nr:hypothetical protein [Porphyrobacter sp. HT-58-2]AUX69199.1 hypothetical protein CHX26_06525 [Porphyrobacter sp. HT-58-2]
MDMADLLHRYFGTRDLAAIAPAALPDGIERMRVDFGMMQDRGQRFALWSLLVVLGDAPDLDIACAHEEDREAARNLLDLLAAAPE